MTIEDAIKTIELAIAEVEWVYPIDYAAAFDVAISALRAQQQPDAPLSEWISVKDRMPEDSDRLVLAIVSGKPCKNITLDGAYELATYCAEEGWIIEQYPE